MFYIKVKLIFSFFGFLKWGEVMFVAEEDVLNYGLEAEQELGSGSVRVPADGLSWTPNVHSPSGGLLEQDPPRPPTCSLMTLNSLRFGHV